MPARYLAVAEIVKPHGVRGEVVLKVLTDFPERLAAGTSFPLSPPLAERQAVTLESLRGAGKLIARFDGIDTVDEAETLRGSRLLAEVESGAPLAEDHYLVEDLLGCMVETEDGEPLGELVEVSATGANDVWTVRLADGRQVPIPATREVVLEVDIQAGRISIRLLPGLMDLAV